MNYARQVLCSVVVSTCYSNKKFIMGRHKNTRRWKTSAHTKFEVGKEGARLFMIQKIFVTLFQ